MTDALFSCYHGSSCLEKTCLDKHSRAPVLSPKMITKSVEKYRQALMPLIMLP